MLRIYLLRRTKENTPKINNDPMVMVILWVSLNAPGRTQTFTQTLFWVDLGGCFWMRLTSELVD